MSFGEEWTIKAYRHETVDQKYWKHRVAFSIENIRSIDSTDSPNEVGIRLANRPVAFFLLLYRESSLSCSPFCPLSPLICSLICSHVIAYTAFEKAARKKALVREAGGSRPDTRTLLRSVQCRNTETAPWRSRNSTPERSRVCRWKCPALRGKELCSQGAVRRMLLWFLRVTCPWRKG